MFSVRCDDLDFPNDCDAIEICVYLLCILWESFLYYAVCYNNFNFFIKSTNAPCIARCNLINVDALDIYEAMIININEEVLIHHKCILLLIDNWLGSLSFLNKRFNDH